MHDDTCSCMLYVHVYYILANSIPHRPSNNIYVFSNTWVPMQSGNETNNPLKSGPAKARPAGLVMLPLVLTVENDLHIQMLKACALPANSNCVQGVLEQVILPHLYTTPHHALHKYWNLAFLSPDETNTQISPKLGMLLVLYATYLLLNWVLLISHTSSSKLHNIIHTGKMGRYLATEENARK